MNDRYEILTRRNSGEYVLEGRATGYDGTTYRSALEEYERLEKPRFVGDGQNVLVRNMRTGRVAHYLIKPKDGYEFEWITGETES